MSHPDATTDPAKVSEVRELMESIDVAMLTSVESGSDRLVSRPLSTQVAEDDGDVLFLVQRSSAVVADITADPRVNVAYSSRKAWISLTGTAELIEDRAQVEKLWSKGAAMFMEGGPENPDNVVLKVHGDTAELWGSDSLAKTAVSIVRSVTGKDDDDKGSTTVQLP